MDFSLSPREEALRQEIREFIRQELPPDWDGEEEYSEEAWPFTRQMSRKLASRGWLTMAWPKEYGGRGASVLEQVVYREEATYHRVPGLDMGVGGVSWVGPTLMLFGTEEQKKAHLPPIARGERYWCTGYSEPGAGSDLASLQTRAVAQGDYYTINGQKVWTSAAHRSDWCWLAARTDPNVPKHKGISLFLVDMKAPGVTVRPVINMAGTHHFNEVYFEDVRVPRTNRVGEENRGWYVLAVALDFERSGVHFVAMAKRNLDDLIGYLKGQGLLAQGSPFRHQLAELAIEAQVGRWLAYRVGWMQGQGLIPNKEASTAKVFGAELNQRVARAAMAALGLYGQLDSSSSRAPLKGRIKYLYLRSVGNTIEAGTSEVQRNIISQRGLGLPRVD